MRESNYDELTLKAIAEDCFLTAWNINYGDLEEELEEDDLELDIRAKREWRAMEIVINLGERIARVAGIDQNDLWIPTELKSLVEV